MSQATDTSIIDALNTYNNQTNPEIKPAFTMTQFQSCDEVSTVLTKFIKDNAAYFANRGSYYPMPMIKVWGAVMEDSLSNAMTAKSTDSSATAPIATSTSRDFSTTNNQVAGVDEPDIMKTDGKYFYYVNERTRAIDIIKSPLLLGEGLGWGSTTIDLSQATLMNELKLPQSFMGTQLFLENNALVIIGQRYRENTGTARFLDTNARTTIIIFDVSDVTKPKFLALKDLPGNYHDARLSNGKITLVQQLSTNRWRWYNFLQSNTSLDTGRILPKSIDVARSEKGTVINNKTLPVTLTSNTPNCENIAYALPDSETLKHFNLDPNFSIISQIDIHKLDEKIQTQVTIGATQSLHVSQNAIYLAQPLYSTTSWSCPVNAKCSMPSFSAGQQTLLHKFVLNPVPSYLASTIIPWSPLSQYAMSEDENSNFRILTTQWNEQQSTHLFTFDSKLAPLGKLMNIEPGESFQSSRFLDDKLYLVTFQQIDPLFVIDLKNLQEPKIIWTLKIPGYSSYLHPRWEQKDNVQYLIGLGFDTTTNPWWWWGVVNSGVKIDLYKIDFSKKDSLGNIEIKQAATKTLWWMESQTEAIYNPRIFVWDDRRKNLILPLSLTTSSKTQQCNISYDEFGQEIINSKQCYPNFINKTIFAGTKLFNITPQLGIQEQFSYDFSPLLLQDSQYINEYTKDINPRQFTSYMNRVGYAGDVIYTINQLFWHFAIMTTKQEKHIGLDINTPIK